MQLGKATVGTQDVIRLPFSATARLAARCHGQVFTPDDAGYDTARAGWNLAVDQRPSVVVMAVSERDIANAVEYAAGEGLGVAIQATGHGIATPANGGVLVNTSRMRGVEIDPRSRIATVEAGAMWKDVVPKAHEFGLAPLSGSSSGVGVVGYTTGGGSGFLGRQYGYAADSVTGARVVTSNGGILDIDADNHPDLFWAIRGGTSNFGLITRLKFRMYPVSHFYAGGIYWPIELASEVAAVYREWSAAAPEELTSRLAFIHVPPLPYIPKELHGKWVISVQGAFNGPEQDGEELFRPLRLVDGAIEDAVRMIPFTASDSIARDPQQPVPATVHTELVDTIASGFVQYVVEDLASPYSPVTMIELRHQGGAFARDPAVPSAVGIRPKGYMLNAIAAVLPGGGRQAAEAALSAIQTAARSWATGQCFLNGIDQFGAHRVRSAYASETWAKLQSIKRRYDPENIFRLNRNIPPA